MIPFIYKIDYNTCNVSLVYPRNITPDVIDKFTNNKLKNNTKLRRINKPILTYNSRNDKYAIVASVEDQNEFSYLYKVLFNYDNVISDIVCNLYNVAGQVKSETINLFDDPDVNFTINDITNNSDVTIDQEEGVLIFV